jgi:hypothetical protein
LLVALACDEIVMHETAKIGNAFAENPDTEAADFEVQVYRQFATDRGQDPWLALTMVVKNLRVYQVRSAVGGKRYLPEDKLAEFERKTGIASKKTIKEAGERRTYDAREAREIGSMDSRKRRALRIRRPKRPPGRCSLNSTATSTARRTITSVVSSSKRRTAGATCWSSR